MALTAKELTAIEDQLNGEKLLVTKYKAYAQMCDDQQLRQTCDSIACKHQQHYDRLLSFLN
jgi:rubrerythrin